MGEDIRQVLEEACKFFGFKSLKTKTNEIGNSSNLIYELQHEGKEYILRISEKTLEDLSQYEAEMDFIKYLADNKVSVSKPVESINKKLVEAVNKSDTCYFISVFEKAQGHIPAVDNINEWNDKLFYNWGRIMGQTHSLSKEYKPRDKFTKRKQWNEDIYFNEEYAICEEEEVIYNIWNEIKNELNLLSRDKNSYGLTHYDFHQYNFFIHHDNITVFDFDDCIYHWFICDIAIAFYHALQTIPMSKVQERRKFGMRFIENFLKGYLKENMIESHWIEKIPLFLEYRRICSYSFVSKLWSKENKDKQKKEYLKKMRYNIENQVPYIEVDFKEVKDKLWYNK